MRSGEARRLLRLLINKNTARVLLLDVVGVIDSDLAARVPLPRIRWYDDKPYLGQFRPEHNEITIVRLGGGPEIEWATVLHEFTHWICYALQCGWPTGYKMSRRRRDGVSDCSYDGQHDRDFYRVLERLHRAYGVSTEVARSVEGSYNYPSSWDGDRWPGD